MFTLGQAGSERCDVVVGSEKRVADIAALRHRVLLIVKSLYHMLSFPKGGCRVVVEEKVLFPVSTFKKTGH